MGLFTLPDITGPVNYTLQAPNVELKPAQSKSASICLFLSKLLTLRTVAMLDM